MPGRLAASERKRASLSMSADSASRRRTRERAASIAWASAGPRRPSLSFITKSFAPACSAATAISSPIAPDTMMKGRSGTRARAIFIASSDENPGSRWSAITADHPPWSSACSSAARVATRKVRTAPNAWRRRLTTSS